MAYGRRASCGFGMRIIFANVDRPHSRLCSHRNSYGMMMSVFETGRSYVEQSSGSFDLVWHREILRRMLVSA